MHGPRSANEPATAAVRDRNLSPKQGIAKVGGEGRLRKGTHRMLRKLMLTAGVAVSLASAGVTGPASAQPPPHRVYHHHYYRHRHSCRARSHRSGAIGAVAGAIGGGIIGSAITHGNGPSALLGAGAGALTGNAIGRNSVHC